MIDFDEPSNTVSLMGNCIISGIQNEEVLAKQGKPKRTELEISHDTSTYALQTLLCSTLFRNAKVVKDLQTAMGPIPNLVRGGGYSHIEEN